MARSTARIAYTTLLIALAVALTGCMDASLSQSARGPATLSILQAPSTIGDFDLTISGPGMSDITVTVTPDTEAIVLDVPVGPDRLFDLVGFLNGDTTAFYQGLNTIGVGASGVQVGLPMELRSKIVIPGTGNNQVIQIDSFATGLSTSVFLGSTDPRDIDFDSMGRMYVAENGDVQRYDGISGGNPTPLNLSDIQPGAINSVAVDRERNILYATSRYRVTRWDISSGIEVHPWANGNDMFSNDYRIQGIAVDELGYVYVAQAPGISKLDPSTATVVAQFILPGYDLLSPEQGLSDVMVKEGAVFALNYAGTSPNAALYELDLGLTTIIDSYGNVTTPANADQPGEFAEPLRFVATLNRKIFVAEGSELGEHGRIVSLDNLDGDSWQTFGTGGSGALPSTPGEFKFYNYAFGS